nr:ABC transporter permease subunit [Desulfoglaeba alkanexedens]
MDFVAGPHGSRPHGKRSSSFCTLVFPSWSLGTRWIPLALLWFGIGDRSAVFLIYLSVVLPLTVFTTSGIHRIRPDYRMVAQYYGITGWELARTVILPGAFPEIVVGLRITLATAWLVILAAEMIGVR